MGKAWELSKESDNVRKCGNVIVSLLKGIFYREGVPLQDGQG
jgi:hypothetical protein